MELVKCSEVPTRTVRGYYSGLVSEFLKSGEEVAEIRLSDGDDLMRAYNALKQCQARKGVHVFRRNNRLYVEREG